MPASAARLQPFAAVLTTGRPQRAVRPSIDAQSGPVERAMRRSRRDGIQRVRDTEAMVSPVLGSVSRIRDPREDSPMSKLAITLLAAPLALAGATAPAFAGDDVRSIVVRYDDLNLTSASGRDRLTQRVKNAVETVCDSRPHYRPTLADRARAAKCEAITMRDANVKLAAVLDGSGTQYADKGGMTVSAR